MRIEKLLKRFIVSFIILINIIFLLFFLLVVVIIMLKFLIVIFDIVLCILVWLFIFVFMILFKKIYLDKKFLVYVKDRFRNKFKFLIVFIIISI